MPFNLSGTLVPFHLIINPRLVLPSVIVKDIRHLDFVELRKFGYKGAVFDKDNCLTLPHRDELVPELRESWQECRDAFGDGNILVVSNSAGTRLDPGEIQAESVTCHLSAPVLRHKVFKPSYSCITSIRNYFSSLPQPIKDEELIVVGDRIFTDIVLANRMSRRRTVIPPTASSEKAVSQHEISAAAEKNLTGIGPLSVWTSGVWEKESMPMRYLEKTFMQSIRRYIVPDNGLGHTHAGRFVKTLPPPIPVPPVQEKGVLRKIWSMASWTR